MAKFPVALILAAAAFPATAADDYRAVPGAAAGTQEPRVIHIDANTQIRVDARLRSVTGTDTAAAGASGSMEERHRQDTKAGAAGPDDDVTTTLPAPKRKPLHQPRR